MQLYVDESGDPGMKTASGSSRYYLVATLIIEDLDNQGKIEEALLSAKQSLRLPPSFEFRWSRNNGRIRKAVIDSIDQGWFRWRYCINRKEKPVEFPPADLLGAALIECLKIPPPLTEITLNIDGESSPQGLGTSFRQTLRTSSTIHPRDLVKIRFLDSRRTPCLQLADYLAGMSGRWHRKGEPMDSRWLKSLDGYKVN
jgi:hypothetical protein